MHRKNLQQLLFDYNPICATEITAKQRMLDFLSNNVACFERSLASGHFTGSCWLVDKARQKILFTHHAKLNTWLQLGGHCDGDGDVLQVALKEAREESGLQNIIPLYEGIFDIDVHQIPARKNESAHMHYDVRFLLQAQDDASLVISSESNKLEWFAADPVSIPTSEPSIVRMLDKWLQSEWITHT